MNFPNCPANSLEVPEDKKRKTFFPSIFFLTYPPFLKLSTFNLLQMLLNSNVLTFIHHGSTRLCSQRKRRSMKTMDDPEFNYPTDDNNFDSKSMHSNSSNTQDSISIG